MIRTVVKGFTAVLFSLTFTSIPTNQEIYSIFLVYLETLD